jgi:L-fuconolactonase
MTSLMNESARESRGSLASLAYQGTIVDSHIHLFDTHRPEGVPWPEKGSPIHRPTLPEDYFAVASNLGISGAIAVEASPWPRDNDWLLEACRSHPGMLGFVGNLFPEDANFNAALERLAIDPLFLGIRYGNLWGRDLGASLRKPRFIESLRLLSQSQRVLDSANPDPELLAALLILNDQVPDLRIVIDHVPNAQFTPKQRDGFIRDLSELAMRETVAIKLSEVPRRFGEAVGLDLPLYAEWLDMLWGLFGSDRILFGSDWPNSEHLASFTDTVSLSMEYLSHRSAPEQKRVLYANAKRIYRWSSDL